MKSVLRPWLGAFALFVFLAAAFTRPCFAENWQALGDLPNSLDKVYVDTDSVEQMDGYRIVRLMTVYPQPRTNIHNILMDRHIQLTALDCDKKMFFGIQMFGYLNGKQIGSGPAEADWKTKLVPIGNNPFEAQLLATACSLPLTNGRVAPTEAPRVQPKPKFSTGSGFVVNDEGYLLTNAHVVKNCKSITVMPQNAKALSATVSAADPKNDLALLKTATAFGLPVRFRRESDPPRLGETIGVVGYPLTGILSAEPKATFGQVSSVAGVGNDYTLLQISAPIQPGNSGSPVFDGTGNVVGIVVSEASPLLVAKIGAIPQNVNFAIRGELAQIFMQAHGVRFKSGERRKKLRTDEIAGTGQMSAALIVCSYE